MSVIQNKIANGVKGRMNQIRWESTQISKRIMQHLGIVIPPLRISLDITDSCNFLCPTCSKWKTDDVSRELNLDQWGQIFKKIHKLPLFREVAISGGEPFTRPDILEILALAKQWGFRVVIISNGGLLNEEILEQLEGIHVDSLMISLNSLRASIHDNSRGTTGSHESIMQFIDTWSAHPRAMRLCLSTIIMESNCDELSSLATFVHEKGLDGIMFQALLPTEVHYAFGKETLMSESETTWFLNNPSWVKRTDTLGRQVIRLLLLQRKGYPILNPPSQLKNFVRYFGAPEDARSIPCLGTLHRLHIDPVGDMRLCYGYPPIGNILNNNPRRMWRSKRAQIIRKASRKCTKPCRMLNCNL